eukprot:2730293-Prymnesium_polylepis.1
MHTISCMVTGVVGEIIVGRQLCSLRASSHQLKASVETRWQELLLPMRLPPDMLQVRAGRTDCIVGCVPPFAKLLASPTYFRKQRDINEKMREILVNWLVEVHLRWKLRPESLHLAVSLLDRFLTK